MDNGIRGVLRARLKGYMEPMDDVQREINRLLWQLDDEAVGMEAKWGVGFLESSVSFETAQKWQRQVEKISEAVENRDILTLHELCMGAVRGWTAMEKEVISMGKTPCEPVYFETIAANGTVYRFYKNCKDAKAAHKPNGREVVIMTIQEAANMDQAARNKLYSSKIIFDNKEIPDFDFVRGDSIPF